MFHHLSTLFVLNLSLICGQVTQNNSVNNDENPLQHYSLCSEEDMKHEGEMFCWGNFNISMTQLGEENWCDIRKVAGSYHVLTECLELTSRYNSCFYPNRVVEQLFVRIHQQYFHSCSDEDELSDAPAGVVLISTLLPIILIPLIVYIVVWRSSINQ